MSPVSVENEISDETIMRDLQAGRTEGFEDLVDRYAAALLRFIQRMTAAGETAEDLLQEVFIRVFNSAGTYDPDRPFRPWIYRIAGNICRDHLRARKDIVSLDFEYDPGQGGDLLSRLQSRFKNPVDQITEREIIAELYDSIEGLPLPQRQAFLLFHFQNFSQEEISSAMNVPVGTVKSRLFHAYKKVFLSMKTKALEWSEKIPILLISIFSFRST